MVSGEYFTVAAQAGPAGFPAETPMSNFIPDKPCDRDRSPVAGSWRIGVILEPQFRNR